MPKVTEMQSGRAKIQTQVVLLPKPMLGITTLGYLGLVV